MNVRSHIIMLKELLLVFRNIQHELWSLINVKRVVCHINILADEIIGLLIIFVSFILICSLTNEHQQDMSRLLGKPTMWFSNRSDTNRPAQ